MSHQGVLTGVLKLIGNPSESCFSGTTGLEGLLDIIARHLGVEIADHTFSNVVISNIQPGQADRGKIWWRLSNSGAFIGVYYFNSGQWSQVFPAPQSIVWLYGSSDNPPAGYSFTQVQAVLSAGAYAQLLTQSYPSGGPEPLEYYPAIFVGF